MADREDRQARLTDADVSAFLDGVTDERRRADAWEVLDLLRRVTGVEPQLWGGSIVGFGHRPYSTADAAQRMARSMISSRSVCRPARPRSRCPG